MLPPPEATMPAPPTRTCVLPSDEHPAPTRLRLRMVQRCPERANIASCLVARGWQHSSFWRRRARNHSLTPRVRAPARRRHRPPSSLAPHSSPMRRAAALRRTKWGISTSTPARNTHRAVSSCFPTRICSTRAAGVRRADAKLPSAIPMPARVGHAASDDLPRWSLRGVHRARCRSQGHGVYPRTFNMTLRRCSRISARSVNAARETPSSGEPNATCTFTSV